VLPDHHYTVEWTDFSKPEVLHSASALGGDRADQGDGGLTGDGLGCRRQPSGRGFRCQSKYHLARMTVTPQFSYKFNHIIYRERYGDPVSSTGEIQMVVTYTNPKTGFSNVVHTTAFTPLWITEFGAARQAGGERLGHLQPLPFRREAELSSDLETPSTP
jgi:hypothetical protein